LQDIQYEHEGYVKTILSFSMLATGTSRAWLI